jgi:hypothetical protein
MLEVLPGLGIGIVVLDDITKLLQHQLQLMQ